MSSFQEYPQSIFPDTGDISSPIGDNNLTVTGIQKQPVDPAQPQPQQLLVYGSDGVWHPEDPVVSGTDAVGTTPTKNPVQVAGVDGSNLVREFRTDEYGALQLSATDRSLLTDILNQLKALTRAVVNLDSTNQDQDYVASNFDNADPMQ